MLVIPVTIKSLLYITPYQVKGKFLYPTFPLKRLQAQNVHIQLQPPFLSSSITIPPTLSAGLRSELKLQSILVMGILHTLRLTFFDLPFDLTVIAFQVKIRSFK